MNFLESPRKAVLIGILGLLMASTGAMAQDKADPIQFDGATAEVYKTIDAVELHAHIFRPSGAEKGEARPCIIFFFGGGWRSGSPAQFQRHCRYFAERGMIAITADYRVSSRHGVKANACVADAKSAVRWVRKNALQLGVDGNRIVASGGSAGGHIAACTGVLSEFDEPEEDPNISSKPNAMVLFNPALVLAPIEGFKADKKKLASLEERTGVPPAEISPLHQLGTGVPPTIIFHGTEDKTVPFATAKLFNDAMQKFGNRCQLDSYEGQGHGFFNAKRGKSNKNFRETVESLDRFLVSLGYLEEAKSAKAEALLK